MKASSKCLLSHVVTSLAISLCKHWSSVGNKDRYPAERALCHMFQDFYQNKVGHSHKMMLHCIVRE